MPSGQKREPFVEARQITLSFGETPALRGASLSVEQGEIVAVMGPSGSGKSMLRPPGLAYRRAALVGLAATLGIVDLPLPVIGRVTGPEAARNG